jgi:hypothetical protein
MTEPTCIAHGIVFREDSPVVGYRTFRAEPVDDPYGVIVNQREWWYVVLPNNKCERFLSLQEAAERAARRDP